MKSKLPIVVVDIILIVGLLLCLLSDKNVAEKLGWCSYHCIASAAWFVAIMPHIWQHRKFIKALKMPTVRRKNPLIVLITVLYALMFFSISAMIIARTEGVLHFHNIFAHIFLAIVIVHLVTKIKRLGSLVKALK